MANAVERTDELVRDYLLFRGFTNTIKSFDADLKVDKDKRFRVDKVFEQLLNFVWVYDLSGLRSYLDHLDRRIFSHLEYSQVSNVRKLETSILRLYVVNALQSNRLDKVTEFFEKMCSELQNQSEWKEWFALPFLKNPEQSSNFELYFTKQWQETLTLSLHNFFSIIFQSMPLPTLLNFDSELQRKIYLQDQNTLLMKQLSMLENTDKDDVFPSKIGVSGAVEVLDDFAHIPTDNQIKMSKLLGTGGTKKTSPMFVRRGVANLTAILGSVKDVGQGNRSTGTIKKSDSNQTVPTIVSVQGFSQVVQPTTSNQPRQQNRSHSLLLAQQRRDLLSMSSLQPKQSDVAQRHSSHSTGEDTIEMNAATGKTTSTEVSPGVTVTPPSSQETTRRNSEATDIAPKMTAATSTTTTKKLPPEEEVSTDFDNETPFLVLSQDEYTEHHSSIAACKFNPSATAVASLDIDGVVKVWKFSPNPTTTATVMFKSPILSIEWASKSDRLLLLGSSNGTVKIYDTEAKKQAHELETDHMHPRVVSLCCSPIGTIFICSAASLSLNQSTSLPSTALSSRLLVCDIKLMKVTSELPMTSHSGCVNCMAFNHNGHLLVTGAADGMIRIFDMQRYESLLSWHAHSGHVYAAQFSLDESSVLSMGSDGNFTQWSIHRVGERLHQLAIHEGATGPFIMSGFGGYKQQQIPRAKLFAFDSSGSQILTCAPHGGVIYKLHKDQGALRLLTILGHRTPVVCVDWCTSVNTGMCLTGSMDGRVQVTTLLSQ